MVSRACGPGGAVCLDTASCQAALLIARYERQRCEEVYVDTITYPTCEEGACDRLVSKVCGEDDVDCSEASPCLQALRLSDQLDDVELSSEDRESARDACAAGLEDDVLFPGCLASGP